MTKKSALIIGATGLVGSALVEFLLADADWSMVTVLARRPGPLRERLNWHVVDFAISSTWEPFATGDVLMNCMGTTIKIAGSQAEFRRIDLEIPLAVAGVARSNGTPTCVSVSALGANSKSRVFYSRMKGELESSLGGIGFGSLVHLRPSLLVGEREQTRAGEKAADIGMKMLKPLLVGPLRRWRAIAGRDVAQAMSILGKQAPQGELVLPSDAIAALVNRDSAKD